MTRRITVEGAAIFCGRKLSYLKRFTGRVGATVFFVTGLTDAANKPNHFWDWVCRRDISVPTGGHQKVLRHFQVARHLARDQRLCRETSVWRVLDFHGNPLKEIELESKRSKVRKGHLVKRDHKQRSLCWRLIYWWGWCCWPTVALACKSVLLDRCATDLLRACRKIVVRLLYLLDVLTLE